MLSAVMPTWGPEQYLRFEQERTQPCRDLVARIDVEEARAVIDLGCGPGNSTAVLSKRWPRARITGLDNSTAMLERARQSFPQYEWMTGDIAEWATSTGADYDVVFSNAALQWVADHDAVYPRLLEHVRAGGVLAVQVPADMDAPAHRIMRDLASSGTWRDYFAPSSVREWHVHEAGFYYDVLANGAMRLHLWETEYIHVMPDAESIGEWYKGSGLRPFLDVLPDDDCRNRFLTDYVLAVRGGTGVCSFRFVVCFSSHISEKAAKLAMIRGMVSVKILLLSLLATPIVCGQESPVFESKHAIQDIDPDTEPNSQFWHGAPAIIADRDPFGYVVAGHRTEVRSRWTNENLYFLFICPYEELNLKPQPRTDTETNRLWNWDVAEVFIGSDFKDIRKYKEFEVSPQGEWVDLDIDLNNPHHEDGWKWNSGLKVAARIDERSKVWYACMRIPYSSVNTRPAAAGNVLRVNFYRAQGPLSQHKAITWQPTHKATYHVPEAFGTLKLVE